MSEIKFLRINHQIYRAFYVFLFVRFDIEVDVELLEIFNASAVVK